MPDPALNLDTLIRRAEKTSHGFGDIKRAAQEIVGGASPREAARMAHRLYSSEVHQARMLATFVLGMVAAGLPGELKFLRDHVSRDPDWRVQEILAQAFDAFCGETGYERALPVIEDWLADPAANARRAVTEGLRIWTARPYFRDHPQAAIRLLSRLRADDSEYVRKSAGNALRDISRKHKSLVAAELNDWDHSDPRVLQTHELAAKFL